PGQFGVEMHRGGVEGVAETVPVDVAEVHRVGEEIDEVGVGVVVRVGGYGLLAALGPFQVAERHARLPSSVASAMAAAQARAASARSPWSQRSTTIWHAARSCGAALRSRSPSKSSITDCSYWSSPTTSTRAPRFSPSQSAISSAS